MITKRDVLIVLSTLFVLHCLRVLVHIDFISESVAWFFGLETYGTKEIQIKQEIMQGFWCLLLIFAVSFKPILKRIRGV